METKDLYQEYIFHATPRQVYNALMDEHEHAEFIGGQAKIEPFVGGRFIIYDGYIKGVTRQLEPGKRIVQAWQAAEEEWPDDHYSTITIELEPENGHTLLKFSQQGIPAENLQAIAEGWVEYYWEPLKNYLESAYES